MLKPFNRIGWVVGAAVACILLLVAIAAYKEMREIQEISAVASLLHSVCASIEDGELEVQEWEVADGAFAMGSEAYDNVVDGWLREDRLDLPASRNNAVDSWGRRYRVLARPSGRDIQVEVRSSGGDKAFDTADDVVKNAILRKPIADAKSG